MRRLLLSAAPLALLALSACGPINRGLESVHQPIVSRTDYVFDVAAGGYGLAPGEAARVAAWFDSLHIAYGDRITIDDGTHTGGGAAREAVALAAARYGLLLGDTAPVTEGMVAPGTVRVIVSRSRADVPNCPDWQGEAEPNLAAATTPGFGCASNGNLAAMIADPQDLLHGRGEGTERSNRALLRAGDAYRKLAGTGANGDVKAESSKGGQ